MIASVHIYEDWQRMGKRVFVRGRPYPGANASFLRADGQWEEIKESGASVVPDDQYGFTFPEGVLDAIVEEYLKVATPDQSTERHLEDARSVRDRLLALVEKRGLR